MINEIYCLELVVGIAKASGLIRRDVEMTHAKRVLIRRKLFFVNTGVEILLANKSE